MKILAFSHLKRMFFATLFCIGLIQANVKVCIVIPAYNEETRIEQTLNAYADYFKTKPEKTTFLVVANNCSDHTVDVVKCVAKKHHNIELIDLKPGGKGFAVKQGFMWALDRKFDLIGFVDADMATLPKYFYDLIEATRGCDGAIASRYAPGANIEPRRPWMRKVFGKMYNWSLRKQFGLPYLDTQCGAKIFTRDTIAKVTPDMQEIGWAFDLELLYLCELEGKKIKEVATTWSDQPGSHLSISSKVINEFVSAPGRIKKRHAAKKKTIKQQRLAKKKKAKKRR